MSAQTDFLALQELSESRAWRIIIEAVERDIVAAAKGLGSSPNMTDQEIHFRRGCIYAAERLEGLPQRVMGKLQADIALEQAMTPATAGVEED